jgi:hypothetical protein
MSTYRLADNATRSWTPLQMSTALKEAETEAQYWDVLAMNHKTDAPEPPVYDRATWTPSPLIPLHPIHSQDNFGIGGDDGIDVSYMMSSSNVCSDHNPRA